MYLLRAYIGYSIAVYPYTAIGMEVLHQQYPPGVLDVSLPGRKC
jgi:hypothetical protein